MGFRKTSIALDTRVVSPEEAKETFPGMSQLPGDQPPLDPQVGDVWQGMIWDGGAWVTRAVWNKTQAEAEG